MGNEKASDEDEDGDEIVDGFSEEERETIYLFMVT